MPSSKILARRRVGPYEISLADYDDEDLLLLVRFLGEAGSYGRDEAVTLALSMPSIAAARAWFQNLTEQEVVESLASEGYDRRTAPSRGPKSSGRAAGRSSGAPAPLSDATLAVLDKELARHGGQPLFEFEASSMPAMRALLDAGYLAPASGSPQGYWVLTGAAVRALEAWKASGRSTGIEKGAHAMATRIVQAEEHFIGILQEAGGLSREDATRVFDYYRKLKLIKRDAVNARYSVKHGAFLDRAMILRTLAEAKKFETRAVEKKAAKKDPKTAGRDGGATVIVGVAVIVGALLLLRPLFRDSFERHKWSMEHDPAYRRSNEAMQYAEGARGVVDILGGLSTREGRAAGRKFSKKAKGHVESTVPRAHVIAVLEQHFETYPRYYASVDREKVLLVGIELLGMGASATDAIAIAHGFAHDKAAQRKTSKSSPKATAAAIYSGRVRVRPDMA